MRCWNETEWCWNETEWCWNETERCWNETHLYIDCEVHTVLLIDVCSDCSGDGIGKNPGGAVTWVKEQSLFQTLLQILPLGKQGEVEGCEWRWRGMVIKPFLTVLE